MFVRAQAAPLRHPSGEITGIMIMAREAASHGSRAGPGPDSACWSVIGERLARSLELDITLRHVAETLVPQFADHCLIDLFQGDKLIRRAQRHSRGWMPAPGTWAMVGEQIRYPEGHFCEQAMARMDTVVVADLAEERVPRAERGQPRDLRRHRPHLGDRDAADRPRRAARRDEPGAVQA